MTKNIVVIGYGNNINKTLTLESLDVLKESDSVFIRENNFDIITFLKEKNINYTILPTLSSYKNYKNYIIDILNENISDNEKTVYLTKDTNEKKDFIISIIKSLNDTNIKILESINTLPKFFSYIKPKEYIDCYNAYDNNFHFNGNNINVIYDLNHENISYVKTKLIKQFSQKIIVYLQGTKSIIKTTLNNLDKYLDNSYNTLIVPKIDFIYNNDDFIAFNELIDYLRSDKGCPWDRKQTHKSLKKHLLEECYEVFEAIDKEDMANLEEELGDILLQVILHASIGKRNEEFSIEDIIRGISIKIINRHPYVFSDVSLENDDTSKVWNLMKKEEKGYNSYTDTLNSVVKSLPALTYANKIQGKAKNANFEFKDYKEALEKVYEELEEVKAEINISDEKLFEECGDLLFSIVNVLRLLNINSEEALRSATNKFICRFSVMEKEILADNEVITQLSSKNLEKYWENAKSILQ